MNDLFGIRLDDELAEWIKAEAKRLHCSLSQVIRNALVEQISRIENREAKNKPAE